LTTVTRWREDATRDGYGSFCYVRDVDRGTKWSNTWQPTTRGSRRGEAVFMQSRAEFRRVDEQIEAHTLISVSPEDDVELRRLSLTNRSERRRSIEVTTYAEVALATAAAAADVERGRIADERFKRDLLRDHVVERALRVAREPANDLVDFRFRAALLLGFRDVVRVHAREGHLKNTVGRHGGSGVGIFGGR
jgi:hypothetical protein